MLSENFFSDERTCCLLCLLVWTFDWGCSVTFFMLPIIAIVEIDLIFFFMSVLYLKWNQFWWSRLLQKSKLLRCAYWLVEFVFLLIMWPVCWQPVEGVLIRLSDGRLLLVVKLNYGMVCLGTVELHYQDWEVFYLKWWWPGRGFNAGFGILVGTVTRWLMRFLVWAERKCCCFRGGEWFGTLGECNRGQFVL